MSKPILTQSRLRELFDYNPETGVFTRLKLSGRRAKLTDPVGTPDGFGYLRVTIDSSKERLHRLAFLYMTGVLPGLEVDHINRNRSDNRWINLRLVTPMQNRQNLSLDSRNSSGATGVTWFAPSASWRVRIAVAGKTIHLGHFRLLPDAIEARRAAKSVYHPTAPTQ